MSIGDYYKFVVYGDSISKGVIYDEVKGRYVVLKESFINLVADKLKCVTYNMGKFGNNIVRGQQKLESDVIKKNPDMVLIEFGGNDCDFDWDAIANNPQGEFQPKTDLNVFESTLNNIIDYFKKLNIIPVLMTLPPLDSKRYLKWVCKNNSDAERNVLQWMGDVSKIYYWQEQYSVKIQEAAQRNNTEIIDIREAFLNEQEYSRYLCVDGIHPNKEGHRLIAEKMMQYINSNYKFLLR